MLDLFSIREQKLSISFLRWIFVQNSCVKKKYWSMIEFMSQKTSMVHMSVLFAITGNFLERMLDFNQK